MSARILIADDHAVVRRGVRALLETQAGWEVCGEAVDGRDALRKAAQLKPDVVVLDLGMPGLNGAEATRQIRKMSGSTAVVIFTMHDSEELAAELLHAGACGYLLKSEMDEDLIAAVRAAVRHRPFLTSNVGKMVLRDYLHTSSSPTRPRRLKRLVLTPREREVVQLVAEGRTCKEIATDLGISTETARTHRTNVMRKLELHSTAELVRYALRNSLVLP